MSTKNKFLTGIFKALLNVLNILNYPVFQQFKPPPCKHHFQAMFAACIPEIFDLIGTRNKYGGNYMKEQSRR